MSPIRYRLMGSCVVLIMFIRLFSMTAASVVIPEKFPFVDLLFKSPAYSGSINAVNTIVIEAQEQEDEHPGSIKKLEIERDIRALQCDTFARKKIVPENNILAYEGNASENKKIAKG